MKKRAIILARVSTAGQAEEELPIESQLEAGRAEAAMERCPCYARVNHIVGGTLSG